MAKTISELLEKDYSLFSSPTEAAVYHIDMAMAHIYKHIPDCNDIIAVLYSSKIELQFKQKPRVPVSPPLVKKVDTSYAEPPSDDNLKFAIVIDEELTPTEEFEFVEREEEAKVKTKAELLGEVLISDLGITVVGTVFKLNANGIHAVKDLINMTLEDLFKIKGMGTLSIIDIQARLAAHGLQLKQEILSNETLSALVHKPKAAPKRTRLNLAI